MDTKRVNCVITEPSKFGDYGEIVIYCDQEFADFLEEFDMIEAVWQCGLLNKYGLMVSPVYDVQQVYKDVLEIAKEYYA